LIAIVRRAPSEDTTKPSDRAAHCKKQGRDETTLAAL
jgi:hypothetical protein